MLRKLALVLGSAAMLGATATPALAQSSQTTVGNRMIAITQTPRASDRLLPTTARPVLRKVRLVPSPAVVNPV